MSRHHQTKEWQRLRNQRLAQGRAQQEPCGICGQPIDYTLNGNNPLGPTVDHTQQVIDGGDPLPHPDLLRMTHKRCNSSRGARAGNRARTGNDTPKPFLDTATKTPARSFPIHTHMHMKSSDLVWDRPWLADLRDQMPENAREPFAMTGPHPDAVGSYGPDAVEWVRREMGIELRWWQRLGMHRQLEHDAEGRLLWTYVVESTPRRVGKSVRLRCMCVWRVAHAELLGEPQTVLFTGKDLPICKEIHSSAWAWAVARGWQVRRGMGNESVEAPDGSRWLVRSQNGVYGYPAGLAACDESWAVPDAVIREGLQPALMERANPQLLLTSTAHTRATALMRRRIADGLGSLDGSGKTLLLLWAAGGDADPADPEAWRAASPHWDGQRRELVADAWAHVVQGLSVPDPLEPDPVAGFKAQYLNLWPSVESGQVGGLVSAGSWASLTGALPVVSGVGVEAAPGGVPVVAVAGRDGERVVVSVRQAASMAQAAQWCRDAGVAPRVGRSLLHDPVWADVGAVGVSGTSPAAVGVFLQLVADDVLRHDGGEVLTGQVLGTFAVPGAAGLRVSGGRTDALKAAVWAVEDARQSVTWVAY